MKEITLPIMYNILKEMLGGMFIPLIFISFLVIFTIAGLLIIEKKIYKKRALLSVGVGLFTGLLANIWFEGFSVSPSIVVVSAPVDILLFVMNYGGGVMLSAVLIYSFLGWMNILKKNGCPIDRKLR
ncbi:MAG: DUF5368 family protein [Campylobacteraceae bacterium]|jgi:hypothetical protein|nr:DUF5368 family protein [Campylobacteraceae bacterium]